MSIEENKKEGFISLHRSILQWQWYSNGNVMRVFIHCLLKANYVPKKWNGIVIKRGQFPTGRKKLSEVLNLSEQEIRTALNKLKSTNEITTKTTNKYTIITVTNYDAYQEISLRNNQQITNKKPTDNQQITTNNNINKDNKDNNMCVSTDTTQALFNYFTKTYEELIDKPCKLTKNLKNKIKDMLEEYPDRETLIKNAFLKVKEIKWDKMDATNIHWLLKDDNLIKMGTGYYDKCKVSDTLADEEINKVRLKWLEEQKTNDKQ